MELGARQFTGIIMKGYSGFYYVLDEKQLVWECSLRGKYRVKKEKFLPGDRVVCTSIDGVKRKAVIEQVLPRYSAFERPAVANVNQIALVMALANPAPDLFLLDRMLVMAESRQVSPVICLNKADLVGVEEAVSLQKCYAQTGFPVLITSIIEGRGIAQLKALMPGKITVFSGPSGVGKSSLLNVLQEGQQLVTGEVSAKISRGRHTTRHAQLLALAEGGLLGDTPGFSRLNLPENFHREELMNYYPEFGAYQGLCRFKSCLHRDEPDCAVKEAVEKGLVNKGRYERYLALLAEVIASERRY